MDWKDITAAVSKFAPVLGALVGGPGGVGIGKAISVALGVANTPEAVASAIQSSPDAALKLTQIEAEHRTRYEELVTEREKHELAAITAASSDVNQTMQEEGRSEHWATYTWRPAIGFSVAGAVMLSVLIVATAYAALLFQGDPTGLAHLPVILAAIAGIIAVVSPILGIASWFRGKMQSLPNGQEQAHVSTHTNGKRP